MRIIPGAKALNVLRFRDVLVAMAAFHGTVQQQTTLRAYAIKYRALSDVLALEIPTDGANNLIFRGPRLPQSIPSHALPMPEHRAEVHEQPCSNFSRRETMMIGLICGWFHPFCCERPQ